MIKKEYIYANLEDYMNQATISSEITEGNVSTVNKYQCINGMLHFNIGEGNYFMLTKEFNLKKGDIIEIDISSYIKDGIYPRIELFKTRNATANLITTNQQVEQYENNKQTYLVEADDIYIVSYTIRTADTCIGFLEKYKITIYKNENIKEPKKYRLFGLEKRADGFIPSTKLANDSITIKNDGDQVIVTLTEPLTNTKPFVFISEDYAEVGSKYIFRYAWASSTKVYIKCFPLNQQTTTPIKINDIQLYTTISVLMLDN